MKLNFRVFDSGGSIRQNAKSFGVCRIDCLDKVYEDVGSYLGDAVTLYSKFLDIKLALLLGRVMSGRGVDALISKAKETIKGCGKDIEILSADENFKGLGQHLLSCCFTAHRVNWLRVVLCHYVY